MLKRSFKAGKCKTSLKLAIARIKLLRNKREVQLRQMRRDLAQLLEAGQEQTARIRVEHVIREEKTMGAYDLIELYCELIVARLSIIESQKSCPIDLKEAITSVVFASPRCADIPELLDVRKHFTSKYGKEFIASALELRPDCGVNRQVVEKLSARAPDGETKIKILTAIAKEHNVNWDRKDFEEKESQPPEDLLNGPTTLGTPTKMPVEPASVHAQPTSGQNNDSSKNIFQDKRTLNSQDYASVSTTSSMSRTSPSRPQSVASESGSREKWNMEFKDAKEAAQAAAESAEKASIAARAAAELSGYRNNMRQHSPESHESFGPSVRDSRPSSSHRVDQRMQNHDGGTNLGGVPLSTYDGMRTNSSHNVDRRTQDQDSDRNEITNLGGDAQKYGGINRKSSQSASPGFTMASDGEESPMSSPQEADRNNRKTSSEVESTNPNWDSRKTEKSQFHEEVTIENESSDSEVDYVDEQPQNKVFEYPSYHLDGNVEQSSSKFTPFASHASVDSDDATLKSDIPHYGNDVGGHSFNNTGVENIQRDTMKPSFDDYPSAVFDDYNFDGEINLDVEGEHNETKKGPFVLSPVRNSDSHPSSAVGSWNPGSFRNNLDVSSSSNVEPYSPPGSHDRVSKASVHSRSDDLLPAVFDDSDASSSENEVEIDNYEHNGTETTSPLLKQNPFVRKSESNWDNGSLKSSSEGRENAAVYQREEENAEAYQEPSIQSSFHNMDTQDESIERNQATELTFGGDFALTDSGHKLKNTSSVEKESAGTNRKPWLHSSLDDSEYDEIVEDRGKHSKQKGFVSETEEEYGHGSVSSGQEVSGYASSSKYLDQEGVIGIQKKLSQHNFRFSSVNEEHADDNYGASKSQDAFQEVEESSPESGPGLNLGKLTGGLRNKGSSRRTYTKDYSTNASLRSAQQFTENNEKPNDSPRFKSSITSQGQNSDVHAQKPQKVHNKNSSRSPKLYFDSDSDDNNPLPTPAVLDKGYTNRRPIKKTTRDLPAESNVSSLAKFIGGSDEQVTPRANMSKKDPLLPQSRRDDTSVEKETYNLVSHPEVLASRGRSKPGLLRVEPSVEHQPFKSITDPKTVASASVEPKIVSQRNKNDISKTSISSEGSKPREDSVKKAGHVHPKLPDYDTFAAHFSSLRSNVRQS